MAAEQQSWYSCGKYNNILLDSVFVEVGRHHTSTHLCIFYAIINVALVSFWFDKIPFKIDELVTNCTCEYALRLRFVVL